MAMTPPDETLSLIAGNGEFPRMFVQSARARGVHVSAVGFKGETLPQISAMVDAMRWVEVGHLQALIDALLSFPSRRAAMAGGISKLRFFKPVRPDARALRVAKALIEKKDDGILRAVARELEQEGISIVASTLYLGEAMAPRGQLGNVAASETLRADLAIGFQLAKDIGAADIGQTVVVKDGIPIAIEAIEGTDACILRGGKLTKRGAVVVKVLKPGQDVRFDLPAVGPRTIKTLKKAGATALGLEAGHVLMIDRVETLRLADKYGIAVLGL